PAWRHGGKWQTFPADEKVAPQAAQCFAEDSEGKIWCGAKNVLWAFDGSGWTAAQGGFDRVNSACRARGGGVWVASNSGVVRFLHGTRIENGIAEGLRDSSVRELYEDRRG